MEEAKRKQRQYIYDTVNHIRADTVPADNSGANAKHHVNHHDHNNSASAAGTCDQTQTRSSNLKLYSAKPTAVHISILKIQPKA
jgi:hypothetical protein